MKTENVSDQTAKKYTRRSWLAFLGFFAAGGAGFAGWKWLQNQPLDGGIRGGIPQPLRDGLNASENAFTRFFSKARLVKQFPKSEAAPKPRVNGNAGLDPADFTIADWKLNLTKADDKTLQISMDELKKLPRTEVVYEFKCIEGWSQVQHWGGVRFADFAQHYGLTKEVGLKYVGMSTPDEEYYVGIDMASALHPQTLLAYEMSGQPLTDLRHGAPLRLIIPVKYGVKNLKRIGNVYFSDEKPTDFWAERGYDYYIGH